MKKEFPNEEFNTEIYSDIFGVKINAHQKKLIKKLSKIREDYKNIKGGEFRIIISTPRMRSSDFYNKMFEYIKESPHLQNKEYFNNETETFQHIHIGGYRPPG